MKKFSWDQISTALLIVCGIAVALVDLLGLWGAIPFLDATRVSGITLLLLSFIAINQLGSENRLQKSLSALKADTENLLPRLAAMERIANPITPANLRQFTNTEEGHEYLAMRYRDAIESVDHAGLAPVPTSTDKIWSEYLDASHSVVTNPRVKYRYLFVPDQKRWDMVRRNFQQQSAAKYYVRYYRPEQINAPILSFALIDETEVIIRYPYGKGEPELWVAATHPAVVKLFVSYYRLLWQHANEVTEIQTKQIKDVNDLLK